MAHHSTGKCVAQKSSKWCMPQNVVVPSHVWRSMIMGRDRHRIGAGSVRCSIGAGTVRHSLLLGIVPHRMVVKRVWHNM